MDTKQEAYSLVGRAIDPIALAQRHAERKKKLFKMRSVGQLFLKTPRTSKFDALNDEEKDIYLREQALLLAEADEDKFAKKEWGDVCNGLRTDYKIGLTAEECEARLHDYGYNELPKDPPPSCLMLFLDQLNDLLVIMLIVAAIVAAALSQVAASVAIIVIVTANAFLGVQQEMSAASALEELQSEEGTTVAVIRDKEEKKIDSKFVVPGDIVLLKLGEKIPADIRLIEAADFTVKEMNLTGESRPVKKSPEVMKHVPHRQKAAEQEDEEIGEANGDQKKEPEKEKALVLTNFLYSSCDVLTGRGKGVVVKTGINTYVGRIFELIKKAKADKESGEKSPLKEKLEKLGKKLGIASLAISLVVFVIGVSTNPCRGCDPDSDQPAWLQMLLVAVSLTVAAVPESLPVCVTLTLALGMRHMAKKKALVRRLLSVETLGSADIICTDKTGTLTAGVMTAVKFMLGFKTYKITGLGHTFDGYVVPEEADLSDGKAISKYHADEKMKEKVDFLWGAYALCCNAKFSWESAREEKKGGKSEEKEDGKWVFEGDPTETALVIAAKKLQITREGLSAEFKRIKENPFNSSRKMMSVVLRRGKTEKDWFQCEPYAAVVKGASEQVLRKCTRVVGKDGKVVDMTPALMQELRDGIDGFASKSLRVLAVAYKTFDYEPVDMTPEAMEDELTLIGFSGLIDPVRKGVKEAIATAAGAGIKTVMITGDYAKTAKAIAQSIDIIKPGMVESRAVIECDTTVRPKSKRIIEIEGLIDAKQGTPELQAELEELEEQMDNITSQAYVFSRAKPEDKLIIVKSYQRQNHVCAMTGDGVNDGPALQRADIGVAMGNGTDVAKGASDMVLTDNNYVNIVDAVYEGRKIYCNITKFVFFLLSTNVAEVFLILSASILGLPSPLLPVQILWLNLCTDGFPAVALAMEAGEPNIMKEGPRTRQEPVIEKVMLTGVCIQTIVLTCTCLVVYIVGLIWNNDSWDGLGVDGDARKRGFEVAQTMTIFHIVFAELLRAYGSRSMRESLLTIGVFSNKYMQYSVLGSMGATLFIGLTPGVMTVFSMRYLNSREWSLVIFLALIPIIVDEITKIFYRLTGFGVRPLINTMPSAEPPQPSRVRLSV